MKGFEPDTVTFKDNSAQYLAEFDAACRAALEAVGNQAVSHAKRNVTAAGRVDTRVWLPGSQRT